MLTKTSNVHQAGKDLECSLEGNSSACSRRMSQSTADQMETAKRGDPRGLVWDLEKRRVLRKLLSRCRNIGHLRDGDPSSSECLRSRDSSRQSRSETRIESSLKRHQSAVYTYRHKITKCLKLVKESKERNLRPGFLVQTTTWSDTI